MINRWMMMCKRSVLISEYHYTCHGRTTSADDTITKLSFRIISRFVSFDILFSFEQCTAWGWAKRIYIIKERQYRCSSASHSQLRNWAIFLYFVYATLLVHYSPAPLSEAICIVNSRRSHMPEIYDVHKVSQEKHFLISAQQLSREWPIECHKYRREPLIMHMFLIVSQYNSSWQKF